MSKESSTRMARTYVKNSKLVNNPMPSAQEQITPPLYCANKIIFIIVPVGIPWENPTWYMESTGL